MMVTFEGILPLHMAMPWNATCIMTARHFLSFAIDQYRPKLDPECQLAEAGLSSRARAVEYCRLSFGRWPELWFLLAL